MPIMEDILSKNIFSDSDLCKLSPDYSPSNLILRMQMRRSLVKDIHNHGVQKNNNMQRKTIRRSKGNTNINKEIVKIRNDFDNINLKNQIMLKNTMKHVNSMKSKDVAACSTEEYNLPQEETSTYLSEIFEDTIELVIENENSFKINDKPKAAKANVEIRDRKTKTNIKGNSDKRLDDDKDIEDVMKVECKFLKPPENPINEDCTNQEITKLAEIKESDYLPAFQIPINEHGNNLQTLLILKAISSKSAEKENEDADLIAKYKNVPSSDESLKINVQNRNIQQTVYNHSKDITEILNVTPMRIELSDRYKQILKKYVEKWRIFVSNKKNYNMSQQRQATLNNFFDKLAKKKMNNDQSLESASKTKLFAKDFSTYQHRYKVQKHIIAFQKAKLEEQSRMIEELKYNKIVEASRQSVDAMREEVCKTYYEIDKQLKPKIKCLTNELKIHEIEEPSLILHCLKVPQFLKRMEKRAREREEKHALIRERRNQMEEERIRIKQQAELAKAEMDKEEKLNIIKELREKRKRDKIENIRKKQHVERLRALTVMADLHHEKSLMVKYGMRPFRILIEIKRDNMDKANAHYQFQLKKNVFLSWMWYTEDMWFERNYKAENFARKKILRNVFNGIKQNHYEFVLKKQVAEDYNDLCVTQFAFRQFCKGIELVRKEHELTWQKVVAYSNNNLLFKMFIRWRSLPALNALKREQETRKARWRKKVLQVVPDYSPPDD